MANGYLLEDGSGRILAENNDVLIQEGALGVDMAQATETEVAQAIGGGIQYGGPHVSGGLSNNTAFTATSATSLAVSPTGMTVGRWMYAVVNAVGGATTFVPPTEATWTEVITPINQANTTNLGIWKRQVTGSEPGTYTWDFSGASRRASIIIFEVDGSEFDVDTVQAAAANNVDLPDQDPTDGVHMLRVLVAASNSAGGASSSWDTPAGYTEYADVCSTHGSNANAATAVEYKELTASTATGVTNMTVNPVASRQIVGAALMFAPAATEQNIAVGLVTETEDARTITGSLGTPLSATLTLVTESEAARPATPSQAALSAAVGQSTETEAPRPATPVLGPALGATVVQATETESAQPTVYTPSGQNVALTQATETEQASIIQAIKDILASLNQASETETTRPITATSAPLTATANLVTETETARPTTPTLGPALGASAGQVLEPEAARAIAASLGPALGATVGFASETENAVGMTVTIPVAAPYPKIGWWRNRPIDAGTTWQQDYDAWVAEFGAAEGRRANYKGVGVAGTLTSAELAAVDNGDRLHIYWKPQSTNWSQLPTGARDSQLLAAANAYKSRPGAEFWVTFHHEPENDITANGGTMGTAAQFRAHWRYAVDFFRAQGVSNVKYVWVIMNSSAHTADLDDLWPGDSYVDIVGVQRYIGCTADPGDLADRWLDDLQWFWDNAAAGRAWRPKKADGTGDVPFAFTEWGAELGGNEDPCGVGGGDRRTDRQEVADAINGIEAILPDLAQWGVLELRYFDAGSNWLEDKPSVDAIAFQDLKDASEAGPTGIRLVTPAIESESPRPITPSHIRALTQAIETEAARQISSGALGQTVSVGQALETETAIALDSGVLRILGRVTETESARPITGSIVVPGVGPKVIYLVLDDPYQTTWVLEPGGRHYRLEDDHRHEVTGYQTRFYIREDA